MAIGRKKKIVDWKQVDAMLLIQCTAEEICSVIGMCEDTLSARCMDDHGVRFSDYSKQKRAGGRASLRRRQWQLGEKNVAMAIFLGKNYLGQSDKAEQKIEHTGEVTGFTISAPNEC